MRQELDRIYENTVVRMTGGGNRPYDCDERFL